MTQGTSVYSKAEEVTREELNKTLIEILSDRGMNYWTGSDISRAFRKRGFTFSHERLRVIFMNNLPDILNQLGLKVGVRTVGDQWDIVISRLDAAE